MSNKDKTAGELVHETLDGYGRTEACETAVVRLVARLQAAHDAEAAKLREEVERLKGEFDDYELIDENCKLRERLAAADGLLQRCRYEGELPDELMDDVDAFRGVAYPLRVAAPSPASEAPQPAPDPVEALRAEVRRLNRRIGNQEARQTENGRWFAATDKELDDLRARAASLEVSLSAHEAARLTETHGVKPEPRPAVEPHAFVPGKPHMEGHCWKDVEPAGHVCGKLASNPIHAQVAPKDAAPVNTASHVVDDLFKRTEGRPHGCRHLGYAMDRCEHGEACTYCVSGCKAGAPSVDHSFERGPLPGRCNKKTDGRRCGLPESRHASTAPKDAAPVAIEPPPLWHCVVKRQHQGPCGVCGGCIKMAAESLRAGIRRVAYAIPEIAEPPAPPLVTGAGPGHTGKGSGR